MVDLRALVLDTDDATLADALADALRGHVDAEIVATTEPDVETVWDSHGPFQLVVAGPSCVADDGLTRLARLQRQHPETAVVVVTDGPPPADQVGALVRVGAVDLLERPVPLMELRAAALRGFRLAAARRPEPSAESSEPTRARTSGQVVTVASATGGCGKTFVATNLAWYLHHHGGLRVALVDLDLQFGEITTAWHLTPRRTILDAIGEDVDADPEVLADNLDELLVPHESGVSVLAAPPNPADAEQVTPRDVASVLEALRRRYDVVVVDTATGLSDQALTAFDASDRVYVVSALDLPSLRNAKVFLETLSRLRLADDDIVLLLNKVDEAAGIRPEQVERMFPRAFDARIPYDGRVLRSFTDGHPVLESAPRAEASRELSRVLAGELPAEQRPAIAAEPLAAGWWRRLLPGDAAHGGRRGFSEAAL